MERTVAIKKLERILGKKLGYRIDAKAPGQDERAEAKALIPAAAEERNKLKEQRDARYKAILAADEEYQSLFAATRAASERLDRLWSTTRHYKFTVGTLEAGFFLVKAQGDSWEEVIGQLAPKKIAA